MISADELKSKVDKWRKSDETIVFTNGCFDLIHGGHIKLLQCAKEYGDRLIVALNSDTSVAKLKGSCRPVLPQDDRVKILESIRYVDEVILFEEDTPAAIIALILPDVLVKGSDYYLSNIAGAQTVLDNGGRVELVELEQHKSTTAIIRKIKQGEK